MSNVPKQAHVNVWTCAEELWRNNKPKTKKLWCDICAASALIELKIADHVLQTIDDSTTSMAIPWGTHCTCITCNTTKPVNMKLTWDRQTSGSALLHDYLKGICVGTCSFTRFAHCHQWPACTPGSASKAPKHNRRKESHLLALDTKSVCEVRGHTPGLKTFLILLILKQLPKRWQCGNPLECVSTSTHFVEVQLASTVVPSAFRIFQEGLHWFDESACHWAAGLFPTLHQIFQCCCCYPIFFSQPHGNSRWCDFQASFAQLIASKVKSPDIFDRRLAIFSLCNSSFSCLLRLSTTNTWLMHSQLESILGRVPRALETEPCRTIDTSIALCYSVMVTFWFGPRAGKVSDSNLILFCPTSGCVSKCVTHRSR